MIFKPFFMSHGSAGAGSGPFAASGFKNEGIGETTPRIRVKAGRREISMDEYRDFLFLFTRDRTRPLKPYERINVRSNGKLDWMG